MRSSEIALFLNRELIGEDIEINSFSSLSSIVDKSVVFAKKNKKEYSEILEQSPNVLAIVCPGYEDLKSPHIISPNPRLDFLRVVGKFFLDGDVPSGIHETAVIEDGAEIGRNVTIGSHCHIGSRVRIGDNTTILPNCTIIGKVTIGQGCYLKPNCVIGGAGFGFEYDENGVPVHFPHTGEVIIGNNVHIGSSTTIDRATIDATIIEDNVKIDNQVQIAHNCKIRKNVMITGGVLISGGVEIGESTWLAPNVAIYQQLKIGKHCKLGMGAVVLRNVKEGKTVFGNPAEYVEF